MNNVSKMPMDFFGKCRVCCQNTQHILFPQSGLNEVYDLCLLCKQCETITPIEMFNLWKAVLEIEGEKKVSSLQQS